MILYNYQCTDCTHITEEFAEMDDNTLKECPKCAILSLKRLISSPNMFVGLPTPKYHGRS